MHGIERFREEGGMATTSIRLVAGGFGRTARRDAWWVQPLGVFIGLSTFLV